MSCDLQQLFVKSNTCKIWMNGGENLVKLSRRFHDTFAKFEQVFVRLRNVL